MGAVVGEKVTRAIDRCIDKKLPLVVVSCSGGARMMEGAISLMQMSIRGRWPAWMKCGSPIFPC